MNTSHHHDGPPTAAPVPPLSLLGSGIGPRLAIAALASALLWLVIAWALN
jgi:hypothetical protein